MNIRSSSPLATCAVCGPITWIVTEAIDARAQRLRCGECGHQVDSAAADVSDGAPPAITEELAQPQGGRTEP
jgi:hypothetical protein